MATQTSLITFTGRVGNLIGYRRKNKHYLRSMPETVRQTTATRRAAQRFGMASRKGRLIRSAFTNALDIRCDGSHINRLNKVLIEAGSHNNGAMAGFRFNQHTGIERFFTIAPQLSADGILHIPSQTLPQLKGITALEVKVIAARISFSERRVVNTEVAMTVVDAGEPFAGAALAVNVPGKGTLVVTLQVRGLHDGTPSGNRKYLAADIIAVQEPQAKQIFHKPVCPQQTALSQRLQALLSTGTYPGSHTNKTNTTRPVIQRE